MPTDTPALTERDAESIAIDLAGLIQFYRDRPVSTDVCSTTEMGENECETLVGYLITAKAEIERLNGDLEFLYALDGEWKDDPSVAKQAVSLLRARVEELTAEIERLSRERDTGVPEGWQLVPKEPTTDMQAAAFDALELNYPFGGFNNGTEARDAVFAAMLSAAPQPPTVSTQGWPVGASSDLPDEIYVERDADTNEKRWYSCKGMGEKYVHARLLDNWKFVAKHGLAKVTPEHTWAQWLAEMKADLSTLTRERDQAREALRKIASTDQHGTSGDGHARCVEVARSVLHPEKEEKA